LVSEGGLEPPQELSHMALNHARLPIPPLRRSGWKYRNSEGEPAMQRSNA
jgi:hypothetical protein